jgi:hypothetical protein
MRGDAKSEHFQWVALLATCGAVNCVRNILVIEKPIDAAVAMHAPKIWKSVPELWKSEDVSARLHVSVVIRLRGLAIYGIKGGLTVCFIEGIFDICLHNSSSPFSILLILCDIHKLCKSGTSRCPIWNATCTLFEVGDGGSEIFVCKLFKEGNFERGCGTAPCCGVQ